MSTAATTSPAVQTKRESVSERFPPYDESVSLRLTPTPSVNYRCPVSTPANFVQCSGKVRRTKPLHDVFRSTQTTGPGNARVRVQRSKLTALSKASRQQRSVPRAGQGIDYYFVDPHENSDMVHVYNDTEDKDMSKREESAEAKIRHLRRVYINRREEEITNSHWLKALCSQPVDEILGKYRRRSNLQRAHLSMVRSCSTPGEKSLVNAWESNASRSYRSAAGSTAPTNRKHLLGRQSMKSATEGKLNSASTSANNPDHRTAKSEPSLSRLRQNVDSVERFGLSPRTTAKEKSKHSKANNQLVDDDETKSNSPIQKVKGFLSDETPGEGQFEGSTPSPPRYVSFTTQLFRHTDDKGNARTYSKITRGPEHLPYISNCKHVNNMLKNSHEHNNRPAPSALADNYSQPKKDKASQDCAIVKMQDNKVVIKDPSLSITASGGDLEMTSGSDVNKPTEPSASSQS